MLDGAPIPRESAVWSLIDSTPETYAAFGEAFHIYIPYILNYGYEWTRHGEVYVTDGAYLNIRAFALPYADYRAAFQDNPFMLRATQAPLAGPPEGNYMKDTVEAFTKLAASSGGQTVYSTGPDDLVERVKTILETRQGKKLDLVFCIDTTNSMKNDIAAIRERLTTILTALLPAFPTFRVGLTLYKDYYEDYLTKSIPFTTDLRQFQQTLDAIQVGGGRDIPEAIHEALYAAITEFPWDAEERLIILIGDAPPHPRARGAITEAMVTQAAADTGIRITTIILPQ
jgi:hypothetical protein